MSPHLLFRALQRRSGMSVLDLAKAMDTKTFQGTLHRFLSGQTPNPSRATAKRIADYWGVPVEAVYDANLAEKIAEEAGLTEDAKRDQVAAYEVRAPAAPVARESSWGYEHRHPLPRELMERIARLSVEQKAVLHGVIEGYLSSIEAASAATKALGT